MNKRTLPALILPGCGVLLAACGEDGCIDVHPNPTEDVMSYDGLDSADMNMDGLNDIVVGGALVYFSDPASQKCGATGSEPSDDA